MVVLIAGPAGAGKTSMGRRVAEFSGWYHLPEDRVWDELPRQPHTPRTEEEKAVVQGRALGYIKAQLKEGKSVVMDFIGYEDPPQPILFYSESLAKLGVPVHVKVLRPSVDELIRRQALRANAHDTEVAESDRRRYAENEVRCLSSVHIHASWVIDPTGLSIEDVYQQAFSELVERRQK
jgi:adenylate kinase family enzyme